MDQLTCKGTYIYASVSEGDVQPHVPHARLVVLQDATDGFTSYGDSLDCAVHTN